jgi:transcriptional regulator with XRE-family HTH domain
MPRGRDMAREHEGTAATPPARRGARALPPAHQPPSGTAGDDWRAMLRDERHRLRLTQAALATASDLSEEAIRKYEAGVRSPSREALFRILEALQVPADRAREIVTDAGFAATERLFPTAVNPGYFYTRTSAARYVEEVPWPRFLANNVMEIVVANRAARLLWNVDFETELRRRSRPQLHFLSLLVEPRFAAHFANFDECLATLVSVLKGVPRGGAALEHPGPWVRSVLAQYAANDHEAIARLLHAWEIATPAEPRVNWSYRVVWREPDTELIDFAGLVSTASETDGLAFNDWIPADAASHATLERLLAARQAATAAAHPKRERVAIPIEVDPAEASIEG